MDFLYGFAALALVLFVIFGFPALAASVISRRIVHYLNAKRYPYSKAIGVVGFIVSLIAVFLLTAFILSTKFRLLR